MFCMTFLLYCFNTDVDILDNVYKQNVVMWQMVR